MNDQEKQGNLVFLKDQNKHKSSKPKNLDPKDQEHVGTLL